MTTANLDRIDIKNALQQYYGASYTNHDYKIYLKMKKNDCHQIIPYSTERDHVQFIGKNDIVNLKDNTICKNYFDKKCMNIPYEHRCHIHNVEFDNIINCDMIITINSDRNNNPFPFGCKIISMCVMT